MDIIKYKINESRKALDSMIENQEDSKKILKVSIELNQLIEEYMKNN